MDEAEFDEVVQHTRLSPKSREAARLVLVDRKRQVDVANEMGLQKQRLTQILNTVEQAATELREARSQTIAGASELVALMDASYAVVVKASREKLGEDVNIIRPGETYRSTGVVLARSDFHLAQAAGRDKVVVHDAAKLDSVPTVGKVVTVEYRAGRGMVTDKGVERSQSRGTER